MQITKEQFKKIAPHCKESFAESMEGCLSDILDKYEINTALRFSYFISQAGHESGGFTTFTENLNYKAETLESLFGRHFTDVDVNDYAHQPEKIANRIYADRMGNGSEDSGDGWTFRGRGAIQLTGRDNYTKFAEAIGMSVEDTVSYLETDKGIIESAAWFWHKNGINAAADEDNIVSVTKKVNGGTIGIEDREHLLEEAKEVAGEIF